MVKKTPIMDHIAFREITKKLRMTLNEVSEALDVELSFVKMMNEGEWAVPRPIAKLLRTLLLMKRGHAEKNNARYNQGYKDGFNSGHGMGYNDGYFDGRRAEVGH